MTEGATKFMQFIVYCMAIITTYVQYKNQRLDHPINQSASRDLYVKCIEICCMAACVSWIFVAIAIAILTVALGFL